MLSKIDVQKFNTLIEINGLINSNYGDPNSLLIQILDSATRFCGAESSGLLLFDKEKDELYFEAALGKKSAEIKKYTPQERGVKKNTLPKS